MRFFATGLAAVVIIGLAGFGIWVARLPSATAMAPQEPSLAETQALIEALRPGRDERPIIAVLGLNDATETTDYLMPTGILRRADIADVVMLATGPGPVQLYPALAVQPDDTIAQFDADHPGGAYYVIVPAMSRDDDPAVTKWLQQQSANGAVIIGVCAGAKVVAAAGLLDGKRATTHWYYLGELLERHPLIDYVADRRFVADGNVVTTTGITASMPMMLTLIEAIGGRGRAEAVAAELGIETWDARHASGAFRFTREFATGVLGNMLAFWNREQLGVALEQGMDEVSLAVVADAWSRTYRSTAVTFAQTPEILTLGGIRVLADRDRGDWPEPTTISIFRGQPPAEALDQTLGAIAERYGQATTGIVAMQLEYPSRRLEGNDGLGDAGLGAGDPLFHRPLSDNEGRGDAWNRQLRHDP
jgi:putative intracellular protease/amidase